MKNKIIIALLCAALISFPTMGITKTAYATPNSSIAEKNYNEERKSELIDRIIEAAKFGIEEIDLSDMDYIYIKGQYQKIKEEILVCINEANAVTHNLQTAYFYVDKASYNPNHEIVNGIKIEYISKNEQQDLEKSIKRATQAISSDMKDIDKIMALHNFIIRETEIDHIPASGNGKVDKDSFTAYGVLVKGKGVCTGYAEAFSMLLNEVGIENHYVSGTTSKNINHAWNMVKLGDSWYHVDVMWDDEKTENSIMQNISLIGNNPKYFNYPIYKYFLKSDNAMKNKNHIVWDNTLPKAKNTKYDNDDIFKTAGSDKHYYNGDWYYINIIDNKPHIVKSDAIGNNTNVIPIDKEVYSMVGIGNKIYYSDFNYGYVYNLETGKEEICYTPKQGYGVLCLKLNNGKIKVQLYKKTK